MVRDGMMAGSVGTVVENRVGADASYAVFDEVWACKYEMAAFSRCGLSPNAPRPALHDGQRSPRISPVM